jgi:hypothetical protein
LTGRRFSSEENLKELFSFKARLIILRSPVVIQN